MPVPFPPLDVQRALVAQLQATQTAVRQMQQKAHELRANAIAQFDDQLLAE